MKQLTKAEEQIMHILWELKKAYVRDMLEHFPDPKPAYNTVSTIIRILEKKGFVGYTSYGKSHEYYPLVPKIAYRTNFFRSFVKNYFGNSYTALTSYFANEENLSLEELEELRSYLDKEIGEIERKNKN